MTCKDYQHPHRSNGRFIVLEGPDGCGSTTQIHRLAAWIFEHDTRYTVTLAREPSGGHFGQIIRKILSNEIVVTDPDQILSLWQQDRFEHIPREIEPALDAGGIVLMDRYWFSTWCYQPTQGLDEDKIYAAHTMFPVPDLVLFLDVGDDVAKARREKRGGRPELFEDTETQRVVASNYRRLKKRFPHINFRVIDGNKGIEEVTEQCIPEVKKILPYEGRPMMSPYG